MIKKVLKNMERNSYNEIYQLQFQTEQYYQRRKLMINESYTDKNYKLKVRTNYIQLTMQLTESQT